MTTLDYLVSESPRISLLLMKNKAEFGLLCAGELDIHCFQTWIPGTASIRSHCKLSLKQLRQEIVRFMSSLLANVYHKETPTDSNLFP